MKRKKCRIIIFLLGLSAITCFIIISHRYPSKEIMNKEIKYELSSIKSKKEFVKMIVDNNNTNALHSNIGGSGSFASSNVEQSGFNNYSDTNSQLKNVIEGDIIKRHGQYIYIVYKNLIYIVDSNPQELKVVNEIYLKNETNISEIFIDDDNLIIVGNKRGFNIDAADDFQHRYDMNRNTSFVKIYNLDNIDSPKIIKDYTFDGIYISGRIIDHNFYMVSSRLVDYYSNVILESDVNETLLPMYMDNMTGKRNMIDYDKIKYIPDHIETSYLITIGMDLSNIDDVPHVNAYLASPDNIYVSEKHMYIGAYDSEEDKTAIYKFGLEDGHIIENDIGVTDGYIVNPSSMDEYNNHFRIIMTKNNWDNGVNTPSNNIYILDCEMNVVGKLENLVGDSEMTARFIEDRLYMVTYDNNYSFTVINMSDMCKPEILGSSAISDYSRYLYMFDDNHILGFGEDTVKKIYEIQGGLNISMFNVADVDDVVEKDKITIGDKGTDSEVLTDKKALLYMEDLNIIIFPVEVIENDKCIFRGAYVYELNNYELKLKGKISKFNQTECQSFKNCSDEQIKRILYIDEYLYTISKYSINVYDINNLNMVSSIDM